MIYGHIITIENGQLSIRTEDLKDIRYNKEEGTIELNLQYEMYINMTATASIPRLKMESKQLFIWFSDVIAQTIRCDEQGAIITFIFRSDYTKTMTNKPKTTGQIMLDMVNGASTNE